MPKPSLSRPQVPKAEHASKPIRVLLSDDQALVRAAIRALLERIEDVEVVADGGSGPQTVELIKELKPDIVLFDITMPALKGLEVLKEIVDHVPGVRMIALTAQENEEFAVHALHSGAAGILPKSAASTELELAVKAVARGEYYLASEISKQTILKYLKNAASGEFLSELTARQREVLEMIAEGHSTKAIARLLDISVKTVETHRAQLMERLHIFDIAGLVRYAIKTGLVSDD